jgi:hypothetical protein
MVLHRAAHRNPHTLRLLGFAVAYTFAMATGTALLIATFSAFDHGPTPVGGAGVTAAEVVMQQTAERAMQAQRSVVLASRNLANDKRGL